MKRRKREGRRVVLKIVAIHCSRTKAFLSGRNRTIEVALMEAPIDTWCRREKKTVLTETMNASESGVDEDETKERNENVGIGV